MTPQRPEDAAIYQGGSHFGNTTVSGGIVIQGNAIGLNISRPSLIV